ncbi:MFS transporter [Luedemannella helvata]|uniref:MFS transporter n=1 Tax=Luedemannella helvata TaxID=349315 RepID=A0ABP4VYR8_9ACTN
MRAHNRWPVASLSVLTAAVLLSVTTELLPTGLLPSMSRDLGVSAGRLGLLVTGYALMVALFAAPLGIMLGRVGRRRLLAWSVALYAISNVIVAVAPNFPVAAGGRLLGGLTHGAFWAMLAGYASRLVTPERIGRTVTIVSGGGTASVLIAVPAGTALGVATSWRVAFGVLAAISVLLLVAVVRVLPPLPGTAAVNPVPLRRVIRLPGLRPIMFTTAVTVLGYFAFSTYVAVYLLRAGLSEGQIALALLGSGVFGAIGLVLGGVFVDRQPRMSLVVSIFALATPMAFGAVAGSSTVVALITVALVSLGMGAVPALLQTATLRVAPGASDPASALNASAFNVGIAGGALLGGVVVDTWGSGALPLTAAILCGAGAVAVVALRVGAPQLRVVEKPGGTPDERPAGVAPEAMVA